MCNIKILITHLNTNIRGKKSRSKENLQHNNNKKVETKGTTTTKKKMKQVRRKKNKQIPKLLQLVDYCAFNINLENIQEGRQ